MELFSSDFGSSFGSSVPFRGSSTHPKLLTPLGWFAVLAILAVLVGAAIGFAD